MCKILLNSTLLASIALVCAARPMPSAPPTTALTTCTFSRCHSILPVQYQHRQSSNGTRVDLSSSRLLTEKANSPIHAADITSDSSGTMLLRWRSSRPNLQARRCTHSSRTRRRSSRVQVRTPRHARRRTKARGCPATPCIWRARQTVRRHWTE